jgi:signal transduction histidine kinase
MFYRANELSKGSGLGLYIVKEVLMKLTGSIQLDSTPGIGTVVTVKLPH